MSFDRGTLIATCKAQGNVARVVVAKTRGSVPRDVGAAMLVWTGGQSGTIGGGALEHTAAEAARADLTPGAYRLTRHALGPDMGQCCGGSVHLLTETFDLAAAQAVPETLFLRGLGEMPLSVARISARARGSGEDTAPRLLDDWMIEPVHRMRRPLWIWGAGHVGRAIVGVMSPLPDFEITWIDTGPERFPDTLPTGVTPLMAARPAPLAAHAPQDAMHLVLTYSHALDLAICDALLHRGFHTAGLIGSATKWARFGKRLGDLGHSPAAILRITCPIGDPRLGKHPQAIAVGAAAMALQATRAPAIQKDRTA